MAAHAEFFFATAPCLPETGSPPPAFHSRRAFFVQMVNYCLRKSGKEGFPFPGMVKFKRKTIRFINIFLRNDFSLRGKLMRPDGLN
jgi:hypothetical protein